MSNSYTYLSILFSLLIVSCAPTQPKQEKEPAFSTTQQDICDDPDAPISCCFANMPAQLNNIIQITDESEQGDLLIISGKILRADGVTPYPNVTMYVYHTDSKGYYSKKGNETGVQKWHGHLHGWCKTDSTGYYEIRTIKPAPYPDNSMPAHIHPVIMLNPEQIFYINDFVFNDDPRVGDKYLASLTYDGGNGIVSLKKTANSVWNGKRDITLDK